MNNASMNLIRLISEGNGICLEELSEQVGVGERSLRYKINDCNYYLKRLGFPEIEIRKKKLYLSVSFEQVKDIVRKNLSLYSFSMEEREEIILCFYLLKEAAISIEDISEILQVTSTTLKSDLKRIREKLINFNLKLDNINTRCLKLMGQEENIRKLILDFFLRNYTMEFKNNTLQIKKEYSNSYFLLWDDMDRFFIKENVENAYKSIKTLLDMTNNKISDYDFKRLLFFIIISLERKEFGKNNEININEVLEKTNELRIAETVFSSFHLSKYDLICIIKYLLGSRTYSFDSSFYVDWFEIEYFVTKLIEEVSKKYEGIKFDNDLVDGLINHIKPAIHRVKNKISLETPMYDELQKTYPKILNIVENALRTIENSNLVFPSEEVAYIAMHFYLAIERQKNRIRKNILLVCGSGYSTSRFLEKNILERFSVNIVDIIPYNKLINYESNEEIDLVITTLKSIKSDKYLTINVSPILSDNDLENLSNHGLKQLNEKISLSALIEISKSCSENFNEEYFINIMKNKYRNYIIDDVKKIVLLGLFEMVELNRIIKNKSVYSWKDAIKISGELLVRDNYVSHEYIDEIIELLEKHGNYMTIKDGIFLAHARDLKNVYKTGFSFLILDNEVEFPEGEKIKLIITLSSKDKKEHLKGLMELINIINGDDFLRQMYQIEPVELYEILKNN